MSYDEGIGPTRPREGAPAPLRITRDEAMALLSLCMLAPDSVDPAAERGLLKLANACRSVLGDGADSIALDLMPRSDENREPAD